MKLSFKNLGTVILLLTVISCTKEPLKSSSGISTQTQDNATQKMAGHYKGERFGGGIIFFMNSTKTHGLIADTVDLPAATWWNGTYITTGATLLGMRGGPSNTRKIILAEGRTGTYATLECANSTRSGYTDWFLPSKDELNELFKKRNLVGGLRISHYWSSSEYSGNDAWSQYFDFFPYGYQTYGTKEDMNYVRAVRAF